MTPTVEAVEAHYHLCAARNLVCKYAKAYLEDPSDENRRDLEAALIAVDNAWDAFEVAARPTVPA